MTKYSAPLPDALDESGPDTASLDEASEPAGKLSGSLAFGQKLRSFRKSRPMTLQQLATQAEISPGLLSQIERGVTSPSLRTLSKLRTALGLPSSFFFDDDHPPQDAEGDPAYICRKEDRPHLELGHGTIRKELLHHTESRVFEFMIIEVPANGRSGPNPMSYPSEKGGYVLEGTLGLTIDGRSSLLQPGDSFQFDGLIPHYLFNATDKIARVLWIIAKLPNDLPL